MTTADVLFRGGQLIDVTTRTIIQKEIGVVNGQIIFDVMDAN